MISIFADITDAYSKPCQTSKMEGFGQNAPSQIIEWCYSDPSSITRVGRKFQDQHFADITEAYSKHCQTSKMEVFLQNAPSQTFDRVLNMPVHSSFVSLSFTCHERLNKQLSIFIIHLAFHLIIHLSFIFPRQKCLNV